ncbi:MAG: hypothetical protein ACYC26_10880 [Phycisphaerales bacterium]
MDFTAALAGQPAPAPGSTGVTAARLNAPSTASRLRLSDPLFAPPRSIPPMLCGSLAIAHGRTM